MRIPMAVSHTDTEDMASTSAQPAKSPTVASVRRRSVLLRAVWKLN